MSLTRFRAPIELRDARRWLASIMLLALAGGAALAAAQAARRTDTAFARALADGHASDAVVNADTFTTDPSKAASFRAKGMKLPIKYWEIWNEPDNRPNCWTGTDEEYFNLYATTAALLRKEFPGIKIGGPG